MCTNQNINILCGDWNVEYKSPEYYKIKNKLKLNVASLDKNTYELNNNTLSEGHENYTNTSIDYISNIDNDKIIYNLKIKNPKIIINGIEEDLSDHYPIICKIKY